jgi:hypothetical protein
MTVPNFRLQTKHIETNPTTKQQQYTTLKKSPAQYTRTANSVLDFSARTLISPCCCRRDEEGSLAVAATGRALT